ncbi:MAG: hypothetical protein IJ354_00080 [Clostridia bacterium]|nr:hypothetical protein [Clostridia bacterium]
MSENNNTRFVRRAVILSLILAVALTTVVWLYVQKRPELTHQAARDAAFAAEYEHMQESLAWLEVNAEEPLYRLAVLECASLADYNGDHELALEMLDSIETDEQTEELRMQCTYHIALKLYEQGEHLRAARTAAEVKQYEPAQSLYQVAQSAYQASLPTPTPSPMPTPSPTPSPTPLPTPEPEVQTLVAATAVPTPVPTPTPVPKPELWAENRIATGFAHTVVLMEDGTVRAFGDNTYGQSDVSGWQNVTAVAAGAYHTVGLTADGRVLACGDNTHSQADTALYAGVKAIAAGDYATFMLLHTGEVVSTGFQSYEFLQELSGAEAVWAGSYGVIVRCADGLHASHPGLALTADCDAVSLSRGYTIGVDAQGVLYSTTGLITPQENIARVSAGENAALMLDDEGSVSAHAFGSSRFDFAFDQPVLALSAGANHCAFVLADGTLTIRNADGTREDFNLLK